MVKKLVSRADFARQAGVSGAAVTKACHSILKNALDGKRIDVSHPSAIAYLKNKAQAKGESTTVGLDPLHDNAVDQKKPHVRGTAAAKAAKKRLPPREEREGTIDIPEDIQSFADVTLRELIEKFGTDTRFVDWLSATQKIESINEKRLKNAQTKGELISRELVRTSIIDTFNAAHLRLLKDGAKSIAAGVIAKHASGAELSEVEHYVSDILGSFIKPVKGKIKRVLKHAQPG